MNKALQWFDSISDAVATKLWVRAVILFSALALAFDYFVWPIHIYVPRLAAYLTPSLLIGAAVGFLSWRWRWGLFSAGITALLSATLLYNLPPEYSVHPVFIALLALVGMALVGIVWWFDTAVEEQGFSNMRSPPVAADGRLGPISPSGVPYARLMDPPPVEEGTHRGRPMKTLADGSVIVKRLDGWRRYPSRADLDRYGGG